MSTSVLLMALQTMVRTALQIMPKSRPFLALMERKSLLLYDKQMKRCCFIQSEFKVAFLVSFIHHVRAASLTITVQTWREF